MDIQFIQIAKPNILAYWFVWNKDLTQICGDKYTNGQESVDNYLNILLHPESRAILWAGFIDGKYQGCVITVPDGEHLLIHSAKAKEGHAAELFQMALSKLEEYAQKNNFKKVKFVTKRDKSFAKKLEPQGYKPEQTIFYKEV